MPRSLVFKVLILMGVTFLLLLVLLRIGWVVDERQAYQREAVDSVGQSQAGAQTLLGPLLLRNCTELWTVTTGEGKDRQTATQSSDSFLVATPAQLDVSGALNQEARYRGLFKVNGYGGKISLKANWPDLATLQPKPTHEGGRMQCAAPRLMLADNDVRGLRGAHLTVDKIDVPVRPGTTHPDYANGLHAELPMAAAAQSLQIQLDVDLAGTQSFAFVPASAATQVHLRSDWPHPSFAGRFLPTSRVVNEQGFDAQWQVSELGSSAARDVLNRKIVPGVGGLVPGQVDTLEFALIDPINPYVMSDRAIKYGLLFITLTFVCVGLIELLGGARVHPVQYLLVGLAQALFFLLLLSVSEHLDFGIAYAIAAAAVVGLLTHYGSAVLGGMRRGALFGAGIALLYGVLYVLLTLEQAALLVGSALLFGLLAAVMMATRRLNWYALGNKDDSSQQL